MKAPSSRFVSFDDMVSCALIVASAGWHMTVLTSLTVRPAMIRKESHGRLNSVKNFMAEIESCPLHVWPFLWTVNFISSS